jgi:hypothetical protein
MKYIDRQPNPFGAEPGRGHSWERHRMWLESLEEGALVQCRNGDKWSKSAYEYLGECPPEEIPRAIPYWVKGPWCKVRGPRGGVKPVTIWMIRPIPVTEEE